MPGSCDCCGCVRRDNYRAHRVVARQFSAMVYEEPFGLRTSTAREFAAFYDRIGQGAGVWDYSRAGDTLGPYAIEVGRAWEVVDDFGVPLTKVGGEWRDDGGAMNGESTLVGLYGNEFHLEGFWGPTQPASGGTTVTLVAGGREVVANRQFFDAMPGGASTYRFPFWPTPAPSTPGGTLVNYDTSGDETLLQFAGQQIVMAHAGNTPEVGLVFWYASGHLGENADGGFVTAIGQGTAPGGGVVGEINRLPTPGETGDDDPNVWPTPGFYTPTEYPRSQDGYYPGPVAFRGRKVRLERDGVLVGQFANPTEAQALAATTQRGSYLLINTVDESSDPPFTGEGLDDRRRTPQPLKSFASVAVDTTAPIVGSSAPQDFYAGLLPAFPAPVDGFGWVNATKPVVLLGDDPSRLNSYCWSDEESDRAPRAYITADGYVLDSDKTTPLFSQPAGTYEVRKTELAETPYCLFGNDAASVPTFTVTVHPMPDRGRTAPFPRLESPGLQTREYFRARLETEKVEALDLTFIEGRVFPDDVTADQLTLTKNGQTVGGCTLARVDDQRWRVTIPTAPQTPGAFFVLTYNPAGEVTADRNRVETWPAFDRFPETPEWRVAYVDDETGKWYTRTPAGTYQEIDPGTPPLDDNGEEWVNEPVVCAARVSWLMAAAESWPRPKNVSVYRVVDVGSVPSIGVAAGAFPEQTGRVTFGCSGNAYVRDWGAVRSASRVDGFDPNCPSDSPASALCSYFGLGTTIDPCPPKTLTCPAPKSTQRHSSAFRSDSEIVSLTVSMVVKAPIDFRPPVWQSHTLGRTLYGRTLPQNVFGATIPAGAIPQNPAPLPFLNPPAPTYAVASGVIYAVAGRRAFEYPAFQTATLGELQILVRQQLLVRVTSPAGVVSYQAAATQDTITLSRDDEDTLIGGGAVEYPYTTPSNEPPGTRCFWWRIQAG